MKNIIAVTGADSGLGAAICVALGTGNNIVVPIYGPSNAAGFDLSDHEEIYRCSEHIREHGSQDDYKILINCAGANYIEWFEALDWEKWQYLMNLNVKAGIALTQELMAESWMTDAKSWFGGSGCVLNIISNASHVPMTNSVFYNASKGAFHIATLAMARELRKSHGLCIFGISPNKLANTHMSNYIESSVPTLRGWTSEKAREYQLAALPAQEETNPATLAEFIAFLLSKPERHKYLTNTVLPYGA